MQNGNSDESMSVGGETTRSASDNGQSEATSLHSELAALLRDMKQHVHEQGCACTHTKDYIARLELAVGREHAPTYPDVSSLREALDGWDEEDALEAKAEGWCISNTSDGFDEIQRLDEAEVFHEDAAP